MLDNSLVGNTTGVNTPEKIMKTIKKQVCATCIKSGDCYDFQHGIIYGDGCEYWEDREKKEDGPKILDSGNRTEFASGAVRDMREGKGRMDLMPLGVVRHILDDDLIAHIANYMMSGDTEHLYFAIFAFQEKAYDNSVDTMLLEVGKHFEEGAKKYGENNWQKGIEPKYYIDSAIRHYLKWRRGDKDEPHDRAFVWNIMCCIWEVDWHEKEEKGDAQKVQENIVAAVKETNRTCDTCKYGGPTMYEQCDWCRCYRNWEPKEAATNGQE